MPIRSPTLDGTPATAVQASHVLLSSPGRWAESRAARYLQAQGFHLHAHNYRVGRAEVDLIVSDGTTLLFVEVKLRKSTAYGYAETFVTPAQQERYHDAATYYVATHGWQGPLRFDIIAIHGNKCSHTLTHLQDAF